MRIAYITPYQGKLLMQRRPIVRNLGLAANLKIELIAELLVSRGHEVEVFSQGEVIEPALKIHPGFSEAEPFHPGIPVHYASSLPVRYLNGFWANRQTLALFRQRHRARPFDLALVYNLKGPQVVCATHAREEFRLPVVLEYEDDAFVDIMGAAEQGWRARMQLQAARNVLDTASGCIGVSPFLLSRFPADIPRMLLRGVIDRAVIEAGSRPASTRRQWIVYSGTHFRSKGLEPLITAWKSLDLPGWELHIAGRGELTPTLEAMAAGHPSVVFHGVLDRAQNAQLLAKGMVGINPHEVSKTPGNVFAFKIIEYLAAGMHVITTPMGELEPSLEAGVTYMPDNASETIARTLRHVVSSAAFAQTATRAAHDTYGPEAVADGLDRLVRSLPPRSGRV